MFNQRTARGLFRAAGYLAALTRRRHGGHSPVARAPCFGSVKDGHRPTPPCAPRIAFGSCAIAHPAGWPPKTNRHGSVAALLSVGAFLAAEVSSSREGKAGYRLSLALADAPNTRLQPTPYRAGC